MSRPALNGSDCLRRSRRDLHGTLLWHPVIDEGASRQPYPPTDWGLPDASQPSLTTSGRRSGLIISFWRDNYALHLVRSHGVVGGRTQNRTSTPLTPQMQKWSPMCVNVCARETRFMWHPLQRFVVPVRIGKQ